MLTKFLVAFTVLAVFAAFGGSIPGKLASGNVILTSRAVVKGTTLKPGAYHVVVTADKATFILDGESQDIAAKVEAVTTKFDSSAVQYERTDKGTTISEIGLGGTKVKLIFN